LRRRKSNLRLCQKHTIPWINMQKPKWTGQGRKTRPVIGRDEEIRRYCKY
jgi:hypothetical protein